MLGWLARFLIGAAAAGLAGGAAYAVYKLVTEDTIKEEVKDKMEDKQLLQKAIYAKVKEKRENKEEIKLDDLEKRYEPEPKALVRVDVVDQMGVTLAEVKIPGDEISQDIHVGDIILLK